MINVSVIMPAYNAGKYISESIDSVLSQTYKDWELVIIDDGSTDDTGKVVEDYRKRDNRIKYFYQENERQGKARNQGIKIACGELIAFLDADDLWLPQKLEKQILRFEKSGADLLFGSTYVFNSTFNEKSASAILIKESDFQGSAGLTDLLPGNKIPILTVLCKKKSILEVGGFSEELRLQNAEDYHLWLKMLLRGSRFVGFADILTAYRVHSLSSTGADKEAMPQVAEVYHDLILKYPDKRKMMKPFLRQNIIKSLYQLTVNPSEKAYEIIRRYMVISNKRIFLPVLWFFEKLNSRKLFMRTSYFVFNYLDK